MRKAGVLLHPTSLPSASGIGEVGPAARQFIEWLAASGHRVWQVLPLHPVGIGGCPYAATSAHAAEPLLLSLEDLVRDGWLTLDERPYAPPGSKVDYEGVRRLKGVALRLAADRVVAQVDLATWAAERPWVPTWARYAALAKAYGTDWTRWPVALRDQDPVAMAAADDVHSDEQQRAIALQWLFESQWNELHAFATATGVELWGDVPYFVGLASADVWADPAGWRLDAAGKPLVVSGVPPDAFSEDGQLWGHPLYNDDHARNTHFEAWLARMHTALSRHDHIRMDHFRGVSAVWEVPVTSNTAATGRWCPGPGAPLLEALKARFGALPFIAEDLGVITDEVHKLRDDYELPGMAILQFAFDTDDHPYQSHRHYRRQVVFTGTHDNDTLRGWVETCPPATRDRARRYLATDDRGLPWAMCRAAWQSVADTAIVPMQDLLGLGREARMNVPGEPHGNWSWRMGSGAMNVALAGRLREQLVLAGRA